jgi:hypothetical protein
MWLKSYLETSSHPWQEESWVASICMCYKLDLETTSTPHGQWESWVASMLQIKLRNYINTLGVVRKLGCIHLYVLQIKLRNYINTPWAMKKLGCIHLYVLQIKLGNYINTLGATRKLGCIHLYVMQIKLEYCVNTLWQQGSWVASTCMWCKSNLKIVSAPHGIKKIRLHPYVYDVN